MLRKHHKTESFIMFMFYMLVIAVVVSSIAWFANMAVILGDIHVDSKKASDFRAFIENITLDDTTDVGYVEKFPP